MLKLISFSLDFPVAGIMKLSPTTQASSKSFGSHVKDEAMPGCEPRCVNSFDLVSAFVPSTLAAAANSTSISSTPSTDQITTLSKSRSHRESHEGNLATDSSTDSSCQNLYSLPASSINQIGPVSQSTTPLTNFGTGIFPWLHSYTLSLLSAFLCNMLYIGTTTGGANATHSTCHFPATGLAACYNNNDMHSNGTENSVVDLSTIRNEVDGSGVNEEGRRIWRCLECAKTYTNYASYRMHKLSHSRPWNCHFCDKAFSRKWILQVHERTHTGEKPFHCPVCQRPFADRSGIQKHMKTHKGMNSSSFSSSSRHLTSRPIAPLASANVKNGTSTNHVANTATDLNIATSTA
ncbi:Zinc finger protein SNAI2 [Taenia solium]|eukprot:TsM_001187900 transcript=TsM_001187900 gene=TsM_001187900